MKNINKFNEYFASVFTVENATTSITRGIAKLQKQCSINSVDCLGSWTIRSQDYLFLGTNSISLVYSFPGLLVPWIIRSVFYSFPTYAFSKN